MTMMLLSYMVKFDLYFFVYISSLYIILSLYEGGFEKGYPYFLETLLGNNVIDPNLGFIFLIYQVPFLVKRMGFFFTQYSAKFQLIFEIVWRYLIFRKRGVGGGCQQINGTHQMYLKYLDIICSAKTII